MTTEVYGFSDDLIELDGDIEEECSGGEKPALLIFSDGTILTIRYGKEHLAVWAITLIEQGDSVPTKMRRDIPTPLISRAG